MKNIITMCLLFLSFQLFAQKITISEGFSVRSDDQYDFIGKLKGQYLIFHNKGTTFEIKAYDKVLKSAWDKEVELEFRRPKVLGIVPSKENFSVIYTSRKKRKLQLMASYFSPSANLLDTTVIKSYTGFVVTPKFEVIRSQDRKTILIYQIKDQRKIEALAFSLETKKILWEKTVKPDDMSYNESFGQLLISNQGDLFFTLEKDNRRNKKEKHRFQIHKISKNNDYTFFSINMEEHLTYDVHFSIDNKNNNLVAGGMFSNKNRGRANGYFFLKIPINNPSGHELTFTNFDEKIINNLIGKKANVKKGIADVDVQEVVHRIDGGILLVIERNRHLERGGSSARVGYGSRSIVDYYYDDILVISIQPDGKTHWKSVLHKKQYSQDDEAVFSSYFLLKTPTNLRFIFNDDIKNENTVSEYIVQGDGDFDRNSVMNTDDQKIQLRFVEGMQVGANELVVPSVHRNKMKLVRLKF